MLVSIVNTPFALKVTPVIVELKVYEEAPTAQSVVLGEATLVVVSIEGKVPPT